MSELQGPYDVAYRFTLVGEEPLVAASGLRLLIDDLAHEPDIRALARGVLDQLPVVELHSGIEIELLPGQLKVLHTALSLLVKDLGREQAGEVHVAQRVLDKLPDEHSIRAIVLD